MTVGSQPRFARSSLQQSLLDPSQVSFATDRNLSPIPSQCRATSPDMSFRSDARRERNSPEEAARDWAIARASFAQPLGSERICQRVASLCLELLSILLQRNSPLGRDCLKEVSPEEVSPENASPEQTYRAGANFASIDLLRQQPSFRQIIPQALTKCHRQRRNLRQQRFLHQPVALRQRLWIRRTLLPLSGTENVRPLSNIISNHSIHLCDLSYSSSASFRLELDAQSFVSPFERDHSPRKAFRQS
jgi:hypothetical protein